MLDSRLLNLIQIRLVQFSCTIYGLKRVVRWFREANKTQGGTSEIIYYTIYAREQYFIIEELLYTSMMYTHRCTKYELLQTLYYKYIPIYLYYPMFADSGRKRLQPHNVNIMHLHHTNRIGFQWKLFTSSW